MIIIKKQWITDTEHNFAVAVTTDEERKILDVVIDRPRFDENGWNTAMDLDELCEFLERV